ncbi:MAG: hypothetical protein HQM09_06430 [Candidatus Riflebacteria bacterium]|nr:hypothetical protein [Candidatus Riflebacteria bacterium]
MIYPHPTKNVIITAILFFFIAVSLVSHLDAFPQAPNSEKSVQFIKNAKTPTQPTQPNKKQSASGNIPAADPEAAMLAETPLTASPVSDLVATDVIAPLEKGLREQARKLPATLDALKPGEEISSDSGLKTVVESAVEFASTSNPIGRRISPKYESAPASKSSIVASSSSVATGSREDWMPLPLRTIVGAPIAATMKAEQKEEQKSVTLLGRLIPEEQPIQRRRFFRRWAIETDNGDRFPLTSTLPLLTAVKLPGILDGQVRATGRWVQALSEKRLKFFTVESIRSVEGGAEGASGTAGIATGPASASQTHGNAKIASETSSESEGALSQAPLVFGASQPSSVASPSSLSSASSSSPTSSPPSSPSPSSKPSKQLPSDSPATSPSTLQR